MRGYLSIALLGLSLIFSMNGCRGEPTKDKHAPVRAGSIEQQEINQPGLGDPPPELFERLLVLGENIPRAEWSQAKEINIRILGCEPEPLEVLRYARNVQTLSIFVSDGCQQYLHPNDLEILRGLPSLESLKLICATGLPLETIGELSHLKSLTLKGHDSSPRYLNLGFLRQFPALTELELENIAPDSLAGLSSATNLATFRFKRRWHNSYRGLLDIGDPFAELPLDSLQILQLSGVLRGTVHMPEMLKLREFYLDKNCITGITGLQSLPSLSILDLSSNPLKIVPALPKAKPLEHLNLTDTLIVTTDLPEGLALELLVDASDSPSRGEGSAKDYCEENAN